MLGEKIRIPMDVGMLLKITAGHYVLTTLTIVLTMDATLASPNAAVLYTTLAAVFLWMTIAPELYEEYCRSANVQAQHSRSIFLLRFLLIITWVVVLVLSIQGTIMILVEQLLWAGRQLESALSLPYLVGIILGALSVYSLFRSIFKTLFSTLGLLGEVRNVFR